ncbi:molecular chaperone DnaJ [Myxococcaceae bacterium GXIMD 01537]
MSASPLQPRPSQQEGLLRVTQQPTSDPRVLAAEQRLRALLTELDALDAELESLESELEHFAREYERELAEGSDEVERAERWLRRLRTLQDALSTLTRVYQQPPPEPASRRRAKQPPPSAAPRVVLPPPPRARLGPGAEEEREEPEEDAAEDATEDVPAERESEAVALKRLHRRLARVLHPDLARSDTERQRLDGLMARVNVAFEAGDRTALELIAAKVGAGESPEELTDEERLAHLEARARTLSTAARSLRQQRERLRATDTARLYEEHQRRRAEGRDYLAETRAELDEEAAALAEDGWARMAQLAQAARTLTTERNKRMSTLTESGKGGRKLKAFDPVLESPLVRQGVLRLERQRASVAARALARELEDAVAREPWQVVLTLMAFFAEAAGRPPPGLDSSEAWAERYALLREELPEAPTFERALTRLPRHLELGLRLQKDTVRFGLQLRDAELLAAVPLALQREEVAGWGFRVLAALGPRETCRKCAEKVYLVHLLRTRGLDELNGMLCPRCFGVQKSYFVFNMAPEGLEALLPHSLRLGLVVEQGVRLAGASLGFQFLPGERETLTARQLLERWVDLYLKPYGVELSPEHLRLTRGGAELEPDAPVPPSVVTLTLAEGSGTTERELLELLRSRIERRFRPEGGG